MIASKANDFQVAFPLLNV